MRYQYPFLRMGKISNTETTSTNQDVGEQKLSLVAAGMQNSTAMLKTV